MTAQLVAPEEIAFEDLPAPVRYRIDPWEPIAAGLVITLDEVDEFSPKKPFPATEHGRALTRLWERERILLLHKSRRMMATWLFLWLYLWLVTMKEGRRVAIQSKTETDSAELLHKVAFMLRESDPIIWGGETPRWRHVLDGPPRIEFADMESVLLAMPEGADKLRQKTCSAIMMDEFAFWKWARESYKASRPTIEGGGKLTIISTGQPGPFRDLCLTGRISE